MCTSFRFVRGTKPGRNTGFDIDEDDLLEMERCHGIVVASAIFGLYYVIWLSFRCLIWYVSDELNLFRKF